MLVPEEHDAYELRNAFDDIYGVWPFMDKLPRVSSNWKEVEAYLPGFPEYHKYVTLFENGQLAVYYRGSSHRVEVTIEPKE